MTNKISCTAYNLMCYLLFVMVCATIFSACQRNQIQACFTYSPSNNITTQTNVTFDATCSKNTKYVRWNFGDGTPDTIAADEVFTVSHRYALPGNYKVVLLALKGKDQVWGKDEPLTEQMVLVK